MFDLTPGKLTKIILLRKKIPDQHICIFICFQDLLKKLRKIGITVNIFPQKLKNMYLLWFVYLLICLCKGGQLKCLEFFSTSLQGIGITLGQLI